MFSCTGGKNKPNIELIRDMMKQESIKPQEQEGRVPPENTRALNKKYYLYKGDVDKAIRELKNPFSKQMTPEIILIGKRSYQKACIYCHGEKGDGESSMKPVMLVPPPSLLTEKVRRYSDAQIYHIIHEGQGLMGSYRLQVKTEKERWALVNYIRNLQRMNQ